MQQQASYASTVVPTLVFATSWFLIGLVIFGSLHRLCRDKDQPFWRTDLKVDLVYWFLAPLLYTYIALVLRSYAVDNAHLDQIATYVGRSLADLPILVQAVIILFMNQPALDTFRRDARTDNSYQVGVHGDLTAINLGANGALANSALNHDVVSFVMDPKGLMVNLSLQGSKITKIKR